jgi:hypothetical protein
MKLASQADVDQLIEELLGPSMTMKDLESILSDRVRRLARDLVRSGGRRVNQDLMEKLEGAAADLEKLEAILRYPAVRAIASVIPEKQRAGRPRDFSPYMWVVYHVLVNFVWHSARAVGDELSHPWIWKKVRLIVREVFADEPWLWLPAQPMARHHYQHALRYLRDPALLIELKERFGEEAAALAKELGLFSEDTPMSWTHLDRDRFGQADGKVIDPRYRSKTGTTINKVTGEIREVRFESDAGLHTEGGGNKEFGTKFVIVSARTKYDRVFLTHQFDSGKKGEGGEAAVAMDCFERLVPLLPGGQGVNYDKALRGVHIDRAAREFGWLVATGVFDIKDEDDEPLIWHIEDREIDLPEGTRTTIRIHAQRGAPGLLERDETGKEHFVQLEFLKRERRGRIGQFRFYKLVRLPEHLGGGTIRVRTTGNDEDEARGLNRAEHLRAIAETDADFPPLKARRLDAESLNKTLEDTLDHGRAHSVGAVAQDADLLGFGLGLNALTWFRNQKRQRARAAPTN